VEDLIEVKSVSKRYRLRGRLGGSLYAVDNVTFSISPGETFAVVGETGSGKSTIGRLVLALEAPSEGTVQFDGKDLAKLPGAELRQLRRGMQPVSQDPYSALNGRMRVRDILAEPFIIHKENTGRQLDGHLEELLRLVGMPATSLDRYPHEFSGGQRQRLVIARAIALRPRFVMCDEPLSALDVSVQSQIINLLRRLQRDLGLTYLFISHDMSVVRYLADRVSVMYLGRQVESAGTEPLFARPLHPYTQALLDAVPVTDPRQRRQRHKSQFDSEVTTQFGRAEGCVYASRCPFALQRCKTEVPVWREVEPEHWVACHLAPVEIPARSAEQIPAAN
jgi:peptide/nickel transport system ATP-binding protein/oligopeptide transport system ATP-binding protein